MKATNMRFTASSLLCYTALLLWARAPTYAEGELPPLEHIKPEMIVEFPKAGIVCVTQEALLEIWLRSINGEKTKVDAMTVSEDNPNAPCRMLSPRMQYKVLSAQYNNPDTPDLGLLEIVERHSKSAEGVWTMSLGALRVRK